MTAPALVGTWSARGNQLFPDVTTAALINKSWLFNLKAHLLDQLSGGTLAGTRVANSIWTCEGSGNGTTGALDGTDRWTSTFTAANIVQNTAGNAHSWIVMKNVTLGLWFCIDCNSATTSSAAFIMSNTAFTGGTNTGRPTATKEWGIGTGTAGTATTFTGDNTLSATFRSHFSVNSQGEFNFFTSRDTTAFFHSIMFARKATNYGVLETSPFWTAIHQNTSGRGAGLWTTISGSPAAFSGRTYDNSAQQNVGGAASWNFGGTAYAGAGTSDPQKSAFNLLPVEIYGFNTSLNSYRGHLVDIYVNGAATIGGSHPNTGAPVWVEVGDLLVPFALVPTL